MGEIRMDYDYARDRRLNNLSSLFNRKPKNPYLMELVNIVETEGWENDPVLVAKVKVLRRITWRNTRNGVKPKNRIKVYTITDSKGNNFRTHSTRLLSLITNRHPNYISDRVNLKGHFKTGDYTITAERIEGRRIHVHKDKVKEAMEVFHEGGLKLLHERFTEL